MLYNTIIIHTDLKSVISIYGSLFMRSMFFLKLKMIRGTSIYYLGVRYQYLGSYHEGACLNQ